MPMRWGAPLACFILLIVGIGACASSPDTAPDGGPADARPEADAEVVPDAAPGNFGEACTGNEDCATGYCVEGAGGGGGLCSRECADDCPDDWNCRTVELPSGNVDLCIPEAQYHCSRCTGDLECPGGGCLKIDGEEHCAAACASGTDCPGGYTCGADPDGTHPGMFCVPVTGSCTCDAANAGMTRTCASTNGVGTCFGMETCNATEGWENCSARVPSTEDCDGQDDDCDFVIDDGVGGGEDCDITNANGTCAGVNTCGGAGGFVCQGPSPAAEACNFIDDNCDGATDEAFTDLGDLCQDGVGACLRYGARRCNGGGTATECSAVAGPTALEACNGVDDDCDMNVDDGFAGLGGGCTVGMGICQRSGTTICMTDGSATECSASPGTPSGTDACNYADDDCDGLVDQAYKNPATGLYDKDTTCGTCEINCTTLYAAPNAAGTCEVNAGAAACEMTCNGGTYNLNGSAIDGCEFVLDATAIYVSASNGTNDVTCGGGPTATGGGRHPCASIAYGITRANLTGAASIRVADGTYDEPLGMPNGRSLFGGYRADTWERHLSTTSTVIQGVSTFGGVHDATVIAAGITSPTVFEGFVVRGSFNAKVGGNSYAIYVSGSTSALQLRNNFVYAGRGGPGSAGGAGGNGTLGVNGDAYVAATYDAKLASGTYGTDTTPWCNAALSNRQYANGGDRTCGAGDDVGGGNGGGNRCEVSGTYTKFSAFDGFAGQPGNGPGGGAGGAASGGFDGRLNASANVCTVQTTTGWTQVGTDGVTGSTGGNATGVLGCQAASVNGGLNVAGDHWVGSTGSNGVLGAPGGGGGGGGAGGGGYCTASNCHDVLGGHGGGGGSGGCGGNGGVGGSPGGGAFGIFLVGGATAPVISSNAVDRGDGGTGGTGGIAGAGGLGGVGGGGGQVQPGQPNGLSLCTGKGGRGGDGGNGGAGSGGGGGCGGVSFGIFSSGVGGSPDYCAGGATANTFTGGSGGGGGVGGYSGGVSGGAGSAGALANCRAI